MGDPLQELIDKLLAEQGAHSIFAPSASHRWLACPGSLIAALLHQDTAGYDAAWGTVGHEVAAQWLEEGAPPKHRLGEVVRIEEATETFDITISRTMFRHVGRYVEWVLSSGGELFVERRVDFSRLTPLPKQSGTADAIILLPKVLVLKDLKLGIWVQVFAAANPQLMIYALGAYFEWKDRHEFDRVRICIGQPRLDHWDEWEISVEELLEFGEYVKERAALCLRADAPRHPGPKQCQFCPAKVDCPALLVSIENLTSKQYDLISTEVSGETMSEIVGSNIASIGKTPSARSLTMDQLAQISQHRRMIESFLRAVDEQLQMRAKAGERVTGKKLVYGRTQRRFVGQEEAVDELSFLGLTEEQMYDRKLRSPNQLEDELLNLGYSEETVELLYQDIVYKPLGAVTLVPESDKRPSVTEVADDAFSDLDEDAFSDLSEHDDIEDVDDL